MKNKNKKVKIITAALFCAGIITAGSLVMANANTANTNENEKSIQGDNSSAVFQTVSQNEKDESIDIEERKTKMLAKVKERLDAAVAAGRITQEEADEKYAKFEEFANDFEFPETFEFELPDGFELPHRDELRRFIKDGEFLERFEGLEKFFENFELPEGFESFEDFEGFEFRFHENFEFPEGFEGFENFEFRRRGGRHKSSGESEESEKSEGFRRSSRTGERFEIQETSDI